MRIIFLLLLLAFSLPISAQKIMDTVDMGSGPMVIYADRTWEYIDDINFDGVLNERLYSEVMEDTLMKFIQSWDHESCYTSNLANDPSNIKDTIWLCLESERQDAFVMPFDGHITSSFGWRRGRNHNGTDIDLETGDTVRAAWGGKVRYSKFNESGFGNLVIIRHYNGLETFYAHLNEHLVVPNQVVVAGEPIGLGGNTGHSYGSHLHFEVRFFDIPMDPEKIIDFKNKTVFDENLLVNSSLFRPGTSTSSSAVASSAGGKYYRIRSGDTLGAIAGRNRTTVSKLCQLNGIRPTTVLQVGRNLRVR